MGGAADHRVEKPRTAAKLPGSQWFLVLPERPQRSHEMQQNASAVDRVWSATPNSRERQTPSLLFAVPSRIDAKDAADLRWRFRNPPLVGVPESGFSGQLERASHFSLGMQPCVKCGGSVRDDRKGSGFAPAGKYLKFSYRRALTLYRRDWCKQNGYTVVSQRSIDMLGLFAEAGEAAKKMITPERLAEVIPDIPEKYCRYCPRCEGDGEVERRRAGKTPVTASPTGSSKGGNGAPASPVIDVVSLVRYGKISRLLEKVMSVSPWARGAIEVYMSEGGGSTHALWPFSDAGQRFLDTLPNPQGLPPDALFENERAAQETSPTDERRHALAAIVREVSERWDEACRVWNAAARQ